MSLDIWSVDSNCSILEECLRFILLEHDQSGKVILETLRHAIQGLDFL